MADAATKVWWGGYCGHSAPRSPLRDNGWDLVGAQSAAMASSMQDQIGDLVRMRDQRQMTGLNLDRLGSAMKRSSSGEIVLSSVEMAYQLGLERQAARVVFPENRVSETRPCTA